MQTTNSKSLITTIILFASVCLSACNQSNNESDNTNLNIFQELIGMSDKSCSNLHKVTDVDDLIQQMYDTIDSYCLFDMPTEELEKIWGIKVFDFIDLESLSSEERSAMNEEQYNEYIDPFDQVNLEFREYVKNGEGLFVIKRLGGSGEHFNIVPTDSYRLKVGGLLGGSLDKGQFPYGLPEPKIYTLPHDSYNLPNLDPFMEPVVVPENTVYTSMTYYWWVNNDNDIDKPFLEIQTDPYSLPSTPRFYKNGKKHNEAEYIFNEKDDMSPSSIG